MSRPTHPDDLGRLARGIAAVVDAVRRRPWLTLGVCGVSVVVCGLLALAKLEYRTQRNDLLSAEKECQKRWQKYLDAFGDDDDLIVVVSGGGRAEKIAAADALAAGLRARADLFDRIFHTVDLRPLASRSLYLLPVDELEAIDRRLDGMAPLLGPWADVGWRTLCLQALLVQGVAGGTSSADRDLRTLLPRLLDTAAATLADPAGYQNPWPTGTPAGDASRLTEPQHFFTPDGQLALVLARPIKHGDSFTPAKVAIAAARRVLAEVQAAHPAVTLGLTGLPVLETDEMAASEEDSTFASWFALLGVAALYLVVYRGVRYPLLTVSTLLVGTAWALGWATLTVGHLNILSATFAVMLIGLGDYGVLWVARYDEEKRYGRPPDEAQSETARHAGPGIVTAALGTALAFFATLLADFQAVAELGWIAGCGVLFCALACMTFLPAMLTVCDRSAGGRPVTLPVDYGRTFLPVLSARPRLVLGLTLLAIAACGVWAGRVRYDANLLNMQAVGLDSVRWEHELIRHAAGATWDALTIAPDRSTALAVKARYEATPGVGRVVEVASLLPDDVDRKTPIIAGIRQKLARLPAQLPHGVASDPVAVATVLPRLAGNHPLAAGLNRPDAADRLGQFDHRLRADLFADLHRLARVCEPTPITTADLPVPLRERYLGANGEFLVRAFAAESLWEYDKLEPFTRAARTVDPEATGKSFRTLEGLDQMRAGFEKAGAFALVVIVAVLWLDFRSLGGLLLGLLPLALGAVVLLGVLGLTGVPLNPANLIALPLIIGVGVDNGVHVLHDYAERTPGTAYRLGAATGRGIAVAALTTVLGFGTLMTARHQGMASLGLVLAAGVSCCLVVALVVLPACLRLIDLSRLRKGQRRRPADTRRVA